MAVYFFVKFNEIIKPQMYKVRFVVMLSYIHTHTLLLHIIQLKW